MIEFKGLKMVKGFKDYNKPWKRVIIHPTFVFESEKYFYFINLTSTKEKLRDVLRNTKEYTFIGKNVWHNGIKQDEIIMNLMILVARCNKNTVETYDVIPEFLTQIQIKGTYKCSNYYELVDDVLNKIKNNRNSFFVYNGNDDDYQHPDLEGEEANLPQELLNTITKYQKKSS